MVWIGELVSYTDAELAEIAGLMGELSPESTCTASRLAAVVADPGSHLFVLRSEDCGGVAGAAGSAGAIVGCACLCVAHTPETVLGFVEAVVVASSFRGRGYGRLLMDAVVDAARSMGVSSLHLTSRPSRIAANALYKSMGFEFHETNVYVMEV